MFFETMLTRVKILSLVYGVALGGLAHVLYPNLGSRNMYMAAGAAFGLACAYGFISSPVCPLTMVPAAEKKTEA